MVVSASIWTRRKDLKKVMRLLLWMSRKRVFQGIIKCKKAKTINYLAHGCVAGVQQTNGCYGMSQERKSGATVKAGYSSDLSGSYLIFFVLFYHVHHSRVTNKCNFSISVCKHWFSSRIILQHSVLPGSDTPTPFSKSHALSSVLLCRPWLLVGSLE